MIPDERVRTRRRAPSLRTQFLGVVLAGVVLPLAMVGYWLSSSAVRSGEALLRSQLDDVLARQAADISGRWLHRRSDVALLAENAPIRASLTGAGTDSIAPFLTEAFTTMPALQSVVIRDARRQVRWVLGDRPADGVASPAPGDIVARSPTIPLRVPVPGDAADLGEVEAMVRVSALIALPNAVPADGPMLAIRHRLTRAWLVPPAAPGESLETSRFQWDGGEWLVARRALDDPPVELVLASRLDPIIAPFARNARVGAVALAIAAAVVILVAIFSTVRLTRSLEELAVAADAVSHGDLARRIGARSPDEVDRVARAFNTMTDNLRRMLRERAQGEALAAMGELAAVLAHQVRSPLTSMRLDLQRVQGRLGGAVPERELVTRAIQQLDRLERAVGGALRMAKSAAGTFESLDLLTPLERAVAGVEHEFRVRGAVLELERPNGQRLDIRGDAGTLEQLFSNVLLNAAQAVREGDRVGVRAGRTDGRVHVVVEDSGVGMSAATLSRIFEPYYSTKPDGTGIGLAVAQRIVSAHGGEIAITSEEGRGTRVAISFMQA